MNPALTLSADLNEEAVELHEFCKTAPEYLELFNVWLGNPDLDKLRYLRPVDDEDDEFESIDKDDLPELEREYTDVRGDEVYVGDVYRGKLVADGITYKCIAVHHDFTGLNIIGVAE